MSQIIVRPATNADFDTLLRFEQGVIAAERPFDPTIREGPVNYYDLRHMLTAPEVMLMVAELDGVPIASGYARIEKGRHYLKHTHHAYLGFMYVVPEHRGKGVNRLVIDALKNWAISKEINELRLDVYYENHPAIAAYEKLGFVKHLIQMRRDTTAASGPPVTSANPGSRPPPITLHPQPTLKKMSTQLLVADLEKSISFYTGPLNFHVEFRYDDFYAGIGRDGHSIHLKQSAPLPDERDHRRNNGHVDITFSVEAIEQLYNFLTNASVPMIQTLRAMPYGKEFYVSDPDGYIIAFMEE
ncbi:MAG: GNAT family N-acetyltransferase [Bacteroidetes bacterium]|nr:GNAT family N-acetyltransferase [Bacteroidota bacterium]